MEKIIDVIVIVFPDGTTFWNNKTDLENTKGIIDNWENKNPSYKESGLTLGFIEIKMFEKDYWTMIATR